MIQYLTNVLGLRYWPKFQAAHSVVESNDSSELLAPTPQAQLLFLFLDAQDSHWTSEHETVFANLIKAMGLTKDQVWKSPVVAISLVDYLNRLRHWGCQAPTVILSANPDLSADLQELGPQTWIEIYSISHMMKNPNLKKISWKKLQLILSRGLIK